MGTPSFSDAVTLDPHQREGLAWMARRRSFLLADEMGLGKTIQVMALLALTYDRGYGRKFLVVCPVTIKPNWQDEINDKMIGVQVTMLEGDRNKRMRTLAQFAQPCDAAQVLIVNYEQVKSHVTELNNLQFDIVVADECHAIKDPTTQRAKAFLKLRARQFYMDTGSPMLNNVHELWSILHRIDPEAWPNYYKFRLRYCVMGGYQAKQVVGVKNEGELKTALRDVMLRRLRKDVYPGLSKVLLPPVMLDMHPDQAKLYEQAKEDLLMTLPGNPDPMVIENILTQMLRLKQICGTMAALPGYDDISPKLDRACAMALQFTDNEQHSVFFSQFRSVQSCMVRRLEAMGMQPLVINGNTPANTRKHIVDLWSIGGPQPIVVGLQVGGVGLNMVAAANAVFLDKLWVPKMNEQAEDRLCRRGQPEQVMIHTLAMKNSVEQYIEKLLNRKNKLFQQIVESGSWKSKLIHMLKTGDDL